MSYPQISFGIIVLNGCPFIRYNLRALYPFAHQIIVVEGAAPAAACISDSNGHSSDGTLDIIRNFKAEEDPENKLNIVTAEDEGYPNGFWPGEKNQQSQAYAKRATGNYLWQVDADEFYQPEDMKAIIKMLNISPEITAVSFPQLTFWGGVTAGTLGAVGVLLEFIVFSNGDPATDISHTVRLRFLIQKGETYLACIGLIAISLPTKAFSSTIIHYYSPSR